MIFLKFAFVIYSFVCVCDRFLICFRDFLFLCVLLELHSYMVASGHTYESLLGGSAPCPPGKYVAVGQCSSCGSGTFAATNNAPACLPCSAGQYGASTGLSSAACSGNCGFGHYSLEASVACTSCAAGQASGALPATACTECTAGNFSAAGAAACSLCSPGLFSGAAQGACILPTSPTHAWDFRGCAGGSPKQVADSFSSGYLKATLLGGPVCSSTGLVFDGLDDYVQLDSWSWGGTTSIETLIQYSSMHYWSRVFDFGNGKSSDAVVLANVEASTTAHFFSE